MAIHSGSMSIPKPPAKFDLRCTEGLRYFSDFQFQGTPVGLVNRIEKSSGNYAHNQSEWGNAVNDELSKDITFKLKAEASLTKDGKTINAVIKYLALTPSANKYNLLTFLVEDGIVGWQLDGPKYDSVYIFHNVLRETIQTNPYGDPIEPEMPGTKYEEYKIDNYVIKSFGKKFNGYTASYNKGDSLVVRPPSTYKLIVAITNRDNNYIEQVEEVILNNQ
jgi:hypothetical protein